MTDNVYPNIIHGKFKLTSYAADVDIEFNINLVWHK